MAALTCILGPDAAGTVLTRVLRDARRSIDAALYEVGPSYAWIFAEAARRGRSVRVLLDDHAGDGNRGTTASVSAAGVGCRVVGDGSVSFHGKVLVIDGRSVALGTGNLVWRDAPRDREGRLPPRSIPLRGTREWWVLVQGAPAVAAAAQRYIDRTWAMSRPPPAGWFSEPRSPEPAAARVGVPLPQLAPLHLHVRDRHVAMRCGAEVLDCQVALLHVARRRSLATVPYVHTGSAAAGALLAGLAAGAGRGGDSRLLLGTRQHRSDAQRLAAAGIPVRVMDPERSTRGHAKGLVADDAVVVSSANWSTPGLGHTWEAAIAVHDGDAAGYFAAALDRDWALSRSLAEFGAASPRERCPHHDLG